jgi:isoaspartyl peptidase/L-asparaginase-like protein (Ntn-hydrolase superfamily)
LPLVISTWEFGLPGNQRALQTLAAGGSTLDAVEQGIRLVESSGNTSVGLTGQPNAAGYVQQDACIMHGPGHRGGSVAAVEGVAHPITLARRVMEHTPHVMLVGEGARWFAEAQGLEVLSLDELAKLKAAWQRQTDEARANQPAEGAEPWERAAADADRTPRPAGGPADDHDTVALLVLGPDGTISGGCSTSGLAKKTPGRVGDSPILGSGLYVDNEVGAAGATGVGENIMRYCGSFLVVEFMRQGSTPAEACQRTIDRIAQIDPRGRQLDIHFIALDKQGRYGAAGTGPFPYAVSCADFSRIERVEP